MIHHAQIKVTGRVTSSKASRDAFVDELVVFHELAING